MFGFLMILLTYVAKMIFLGFRTCRNSTKAAKVYSTLDRNFVYGSSIRFFLESYLELTVAALLNFQRLELTNNTERFATCYSITLVFVVVLFPPLLSIFTIYNRSRLTDPYFF